MTKKYFGDVKEIKGEVREGAARLREYGIQVGLGILRVGENPASKSYYRAILKACEKVGIAAFRFELPEEASEVLADLLECSLESFA